MDTIYTTSYSDNNQTSNEIQDVVRRVADSVSAMLEKQLNPKR
jgi:hypothetical protein